MTDEREEWPIMDRVHEALCVALENMTTRRLDPTPKRIPKQAAFSSPRWDSSCYLCGELFLNQLRLRCSKCGGMCRLRPAIDRVLLGRHAVLV